MNAHTIGAKLRTRSAAGRDEAQATVRRVTGELAELAAIAAEEADRLLANAKQALRRAKAKADGLRERGEHDAVAGRRRGRLARAVNHLSELLEATRQIVAQTRQRVAGTISSVRYEPDRQRPDALDTAGHHAGRHAGDVRNAAGLGKAQRLVLAAGLPTRLAMRRWASAEPVGCRSSRDGLRCQAAQGAAWAYV
jgi:ABC-type transporter Mla subunit MlaD